MSGWVSSTGWNINLAAPGPIGNVTPSTGKFTTLTATQNVVIATAGKGIDFSAVTPAAGMTSQLLADYEEGIWIPAWGGTTGLPTCTYTTQNGYYTKIGNRVFLWFEISTASTTGGSGTLRITGLPFSISNATLKTDYAVTFITNMPEGCVASGTAVNLTTRLSNIEIGYLPTTALDNTSYIIGSISGVI